MQFSVERQIQVRTFMRVIETPARHSQCVAVRALLKTGAKVNQQFENGRTCLHIAALEGHTDVVTALLENGAAVQAEDNDGITALAAAASRGHAATVEVLLQFNADPNQADAEGACRFCPLSISLSPHLNGHFRHDTVDVRL